MLLSFLAMGELCPISDCFLLTDTIRLRLNYRRWRLYVFFTLLPLLGLRVHRKLIIYLIGVLHLFLAPN